VPFIATQSLARWRNPDTTTTTPCRLSCCECDAPKSPEKQSSDVWYSFAVGQGLEGLPDSYVGCKSGLLGLLYDPTAGMLSVAPSVFDAAAGNGVVPQYEAKVTS
jgi:hypothetical protein